MAKETIIDTEYATLWHYPEDKIVHHVWHKFIYGNEFRQVLNKGVELFQQKGANKWLSDDRKNSALPAEDGQWAMTDWSPRVVDAGWKYWAIVMPDKVVGQLNMQQFIDLYAKKGIAVQIFDDTDEALKWLKSV